MDNGHLFLAMFAILSALLVTLVHTQTCTNEQGPCLNNFCPGEGQVCYNGFSCCKPEDVVTNQLPVEEATNPAVQTSVISEAVTNTPVASVIVPAGCADNATIKCSAYLPYCNNINYIPLLTKQCPVTCNLCSKVTIAPVTNAPTSNCVDNVRAKCSEIASLCSNSAYASLMKQNCPATCNLCGGATVPTTAPISSQNCVDKADPHTGKSNCAQNVSLCNDTRYKTVMATQCPKTCGLCSS